MKNFVFLFVCLVLLGSNYYVSGQDCPDGWSQYNNKCWYFSHAKPALSWYAAESWCQQNNGHLASFESIAERQWVVANNLKQWEDPRWWIGLNDNGRETNFEWSDGTPFNSAVANWKIGEPNNAYLENCVEIWIESGVLQSDEKWNDRTCEGANNYVCKRELGKVSSCPDGFQLINERCYWLSDTKYQWFEAQNFCRLKGANLVSISSQTEQSSVSNLLQSMNENYWTGYSDTSSPGTLQWVDGTQSTFNNWASSSQPGNPLPYLGSTCTEMNKGLNYAWSTSKCGEEKKFVCERGLKGNCPPDWIYHGESGKCYEFVVNPNRVQTWTNANKICSSIGAGLLKIESEEESTFIGSALHGYSMSGHPLVYIGGSDIGHDDVLTWWDQKTVTFIYWAPGMPQYVAGREDCLALYSGGNALQNWETTTCFEARAYICEIQEGQSLGSGIITVEGRCEEGWRHFKNKCYFFGDGEQTQSEAQTFCKDQSSVLTSVLDEDEESFIVGHLRRRSWIGLTSNSNGQQLSWLDGSTPTSFINWAAAEPNNGGTCVYMKDGDGEWYDDPCTSRWPFVCKKDEIPTEASTPTPPGYIPDYEKCGGEGWISDPTSDRCYRVNLDRRSWQDARYACQIGGGELASINSPNENEHIKKLVQNVPSHLTFWLGGSDRNNYQIELVDQGWKWSDNSAFNYINWASGEPNNQETEDCMTIDWNGQWNDLDCFAFEASVCEKRGNVDSIIGDPTDENCASNAACCFKHVGVEYGGTIPDTALSASSSRDQWFDVTRGRLNTPANVIIVDAENEIFVGEGHGAWSAKFDDPEKWMQVDLPRSYEVKGIITQGRNGILQDQERQWVTSYSVSYSQDADGGKWEFISDSDGNPVIFKGNADQDTQVTNLFPRAVIARHLRCHVQTYYDAPCMRLEFIGCAASCLHKLGMNSGIIPDNMITASSSQVGKEARHSRAPVDPDECLAPSDSKGMNYRGWISKTTGGITCQRWSEQTPHRHDYLPENYPGKDLRSNRCRNPDGSKNRPWCYTTDPNVVWQECDVPACPSYTPTGWQPSVVNTNQYVQVQFSDYFKVSGVTLYKSSSSSSYVTSYYLSFSDNGQTFNNYQDQSGSTHVFTGLDNIVSEYTDILREPVTAMYVRIMPQSWNGGFLLQFELHGCYADGRATCSDTVKAWDDGSTTSFSVYCPTGCLEDPEFDPVYGTDVYASNSAICLAAIHAGAMLNNHGGTVNVQIREGQSTYTGTYRNFVDSYDWDHSDSSFMFAGNALRCQEGWLAWQDHCYYVSPKNDLKTWFDARSYCVSQGADLASIWTEGENSYIEGVIYQAGVGGDVWIGLNDLETENYYLWSDGSPVTMTKWFFDEPKAGRHRCVNMYRFEAYWNDKDCDANLAFLCKKEKELLPETATEPPEEGCEQGWKAYGSSCYHVGPDLQVYTYAKELCQEKNAELVTINDEYEQAFVFSLSITQIPPGLDYTTYIGLTAHSTDSGSLYYRWETPDPVTYTHWAENEPDVRFSCAFPFEYKGQTFYECTTFDHPAGNDGQPWCSIEPVFNGLWVNCGVSSEYGCTYMDEKTGFWQVDLCIPRRYYICEKDRFGYTKPDSTTPSTAGKCANGWFGDGDTTACYQINEKSEDKRSERLNWFDALDFCRAQGADLVSIHSYEEEQKLMDFVLNQGALSYVGFWVGLTAQQSGSGYEWTDASPVEYTNWNYGEPNNHNGKELCVEAGLTYSNAWNDLNCDAIRNWVCKIDKDKTPLPPPTFPPPDGSVSTQCGTDDTWILYTTDYGLEKCYLFMDSVKTGWTFAQNDCAARGGNLVAIHSAEENSFVLAWAAQSSYNVMWIGLKDVGSLEGRSFQWSDESTVNYVNWGAGEPNNYQDQEDCAEIQTDSGLWNDDNCGVQNAFICEKYLGASTQDVPPTPAFTGGCPEGFMAYGNKCYWFNTDPDATVSWYDAITQCGDVNAEPATIQNTYEQAYITSQMKWIGANIWIGLSGRDSNEYVWHDQSQLSYTNWNEYEPDGYYGTDTCVQVFSDVNKAGKWADDYCYNYLNYACYVFRSTDYPEQPIVSSNCPPDYYGYGDACYKLMDTAMTRSQASQACQAEGSDIFLMSVDDLYENNLFKSWFYRDITSGTSLWTGLTFTWNGGPSFAWDNGWPVGFTSWAAGEPDVNVLGSGAGCVRMDNQGNWVAEPSATCESTSLPFVCKQSLLTAPTTVDPGEGTCDPGFIALGDDCYYVQKGQSSTSVRSWHEAVHECDIRGATLASFHTEDECLAVVNAIDNNAHNLFIGLSSDGFTGWKWVDGTAVDFLNWVTPGEPNGQGNGEDCVEMYPWSGKWNDVPCFEERGYVCKKPKALVSCSSVLPESRYECGYIGMLESVCYQRTCCWDPVYANANFSGCYYPAGVGPSGEPITEPPILTSGGLSGGAIFGIIFGVLVLLIVVGVAIYCVKTEKTKDISVPSMPSLPSWGTSSQQKKTPQTNPGFENPVSTLGEA